MLKLKSIPCVEEMILYWITVSIFLGIMFINFQRITHFICFIEIINSTESNQQISRDETYYTKV